MRGVAAPKHVLQSAYITLTCLDKKRCQCSEDWRDFLLDYFAGSEDFVLFRVGTSNTTFAHGFEVHIGTGEDILLYLRVS